MTEKDPERSGQMRAAGMYTMIPAVMFAAPAIGWYMGHLLRDWLNTGQWLEIVMAVLGMAAGGREVARIIKRAEEVQTRKK